MARLPPPRPPFKIAWIPVSGPQWRVVDRDGNALRDKNNHSYEFETKEAAEAFIEGGTWYRRKEGLLHG